MNTRMVTVHTCDWWGVMKVAASASEAKRQQSENLKTQMWTQRDERLVRWLTAAAAAAAAAADAADAACWRWLNWRCTLAFISFTGKKAARRLFCSDSRLFLNEARLFARVATSCTAANSTCKDSRPRCAASAETAINQQRLTTNITQNPNSSYFHSLPICLQHAVRTTTLQQQQNPAIRAHSKLHNSLYR